MMLLLEQESEKLKLAQAMQARGFVTPETHSTQPYNPEATLNALGGAEVALYLAETEYLTEVQTQFELDRMAGEDMTGVRQRWGAEEGWHGKVYQSILQHCGVEMELPLARPMKKGIERLGSLATRHGWFRDALNLTIPITGHLHERENQYVQHMIIARLVSAGERQIARTVGAMYAQETTHDRYYLADVAEKTHTHLSQGKEWIITLAQLMTTLGFSPVGANDDVLKIRFGKVMNTFMESKEQLEKFEDAIGALAMEILQPNGRLGSLFTTWQVKRIMSTFDTCLKMLKA